MRKVDLRMNELEKYNVIKELVDHNGNKKRAALRLGITVRQMCIRDSLEQILFYY